MRYVPLAAVRLLFADWLNRPFRHAQEGRAFGLVA
ncbi:hypothetical protein GQ607_012679 [Colletotrichum asianum]|uniref:Uncharacterized protein n=1 Tax=Colletotrichum asianum TaxID=702518 RepID=A0A8H3W579_9PEZI|nr:hypothetical protein GQ607_012679 [Colletotrichum asianum]